MNENLQGIWQDINEQYFNGELKPLLAIEWEETSGKNGIGAFGLFAPQSRCIIIDEKFKFSKEGILEGAEDENTKLEIAYRLVMHEMIHQMLYQKNASNPGSHGQSFIDEATRIAGMMHIDPPTKSNADTWPTIMALLVSLGV